MGSFKKKFLFFITLYSAFGLKVEEKKVLLKCCDRISATLLCSSGEEVGGCGIDWLIDYLFCWLFIWFRHEKQGGGAGLAWELVCTLLHPSPLDGMIPRMLSLPGSIARGGSTRRKTVLTEELQDLKRCYREWDDWQVDEIPYPFRSN